MILMLMHGTAVRAYARSSVDTPLHSVLQDNMMIIICHQIISQGSNFIAGRFPGEASAVEAHDALNIKFSSTS